MYFTHALIPSSSHLLIFTLFEYLKYRFLVKNLLVVINMDLATYFLESPAKPS